MPEETAMKILLISPSYAEGENAAYFPLGLASLTAYIRQFGYEVIPHNMNNYDAPNRYAVLKSLLVSRNVDVIGIGGLTIAYSAIKQIIGFCRRYSQAPIVLGGGITSCESELVMRTLMPDYMVLGEGEIIFAELLQAIKSDLPKHLVKGIWYWRGAEPVATGEGESPELLDALPAPDLDGFGISRYLAIQSGNTFSYHVSRTDQGKVIPISASRSCPYRCTFCYHAGMGNYKQFSMEYVIRNMEHCIEQYHVHSFMIYDELFSASKKRISKFCHEVCARKLNIFWYCQLRVDQLDPDVLRQMKQAGCLHISLGIESGSDRVLASMNKKITTRQIAEAVRMIREAQIGIQANFLFGDPAENQDTLAESLRFQEENELYFTDWSMVIPYPGTQLYQRALQAGKIPDRLSFLQEMGRISSYIWNNRINLTQMPDDEYHSTYVRLRELNDRHHRKKSAEVRVGAIADATHSEVVLECPACHYNQRLVLPYPPEQRAGRFDLRTVVAVPGMNFVCSACKRKMHIKACRIPHVQPLYAIFQERLHDFRERGVPVVLMPAMDRYWGVFSEDVDCSGLNVVAVMDSRPHQFGKSFMDCRVETLSVDTVQQYEQAVFIILPWIEYARALDVLASARIDRQRILCWNLLAGEHFGQLPQPAALQG